jgi:hypothetical protein
MSDDSLFREIDEEVRRDKIVSIWTRFGNLILAVCFLVIAGVGGYKAWQYWDAKQAEEAGMRWYGAVRLAEQGKDAEADKAFNDIAATGHKGYALLARLSQAAQLAQDGKRDEAVACMTRSQQTAPPTTRCVNLPVCVQPICWSTRRAWPT